MIHFLPNFPGAFGLAMTIALVALVSEDGASITAATLAAASLLDAKVAFFSAFAGLWVGDLGVYALARSMGPTVLQLNWFKRFFGTSKSVGSAREGDRSRLGLALSRFFPGTRLPAYISAGISGMPASVFATVTAASAAVWIGLVFFAIHAVPSRAPAAKQQLALLSLVGLMSFALLTAWRQWGSQITRRFGIVAERIVRWEFWPAWLFYSPVAMFCAWLGIRYGDFSLPTIANLNQKNGGIIGESKIEILGTLMATVPEFTADGYLVPESSTRERIAIIQEICSRNDIAFPFVLKPNTAQRGAGFKKIKSFDEIEQYLAEVSTPLVLQRYIEGPKEAGVFYYRFPGELEGHIFGITRKEFPFVVGDGVRTLRELIEADPRAKLIAKTYLTRFGERVNSIPFPGLRVRLVEAGNHCQGCIFQDGEDLNTEELRSTFDRISQELPGFYVGRYDIRYENDEELKTGTSFKIIELNGAASEATNIYDENNSLWSAYFTLYRQWRLVYRIGAANRHRGHRPATVFALLKDWLDFCRRSVEYPIEIGRAHV